MLVCRSACHRSLPLPDLQIIILALVQGVTEFLPISSSGHLRLIPFITGWSDQGLMMDIAVHVGSLGAVVVYFRKDVWRVITGSVGLALFRPDQNTTLALRVMVACVPTVLAGALIFRIGGDALRTPEIVAWTTIVFGLLLFGADRFGAMTRGFEDLKLPAALLIGLAQVLALIPGVSRSGVTMTAARALGYDRSTAARFSMLISIPVILGAGVLKGAELLAIGDTRLTIDVIVAVVLAFFSALTAVALMMKWLQSASFTPFVIYRIVLGIVLLGLIYR